MKSRLKRPRQACFFLFGLAFSLSGTEAARADVIISEIMYHPFHAVDEAENLGAEFLELVNIGSTTVNLAGWSISRGVTFVFPDLRLSPGDYQALAASIFRKASLAAADTVGVQVRINGENEALANNRMYGAYVAIEVIDSDFAAHHFPDDPSGNAYRCLDDGSDLGYKGANKENYRRRYQKETNDSADEFIDLIETVFSPEQFDPLVDNVLGGWVPDGMMAQIKAFVVLRNAEVLAQIPRTFTIEADLPVVGGYAYSQDDTVFVFGTADVTSVRSVLVQNQLTALSLSDGTWELGGFTGRVDSIPVRPGLNRLSVRAFDGAEGVGQVMQQGTIDVWYDTGFYHDLPANTVLTEDSVWTANEGPYRVTGELVIPESVTLRIGPGTSIFFEPNARMTVRGQLLAEGEAFASIRFTRIPESTEPWGGIQFVDTQADKRISHAVLEYGRTNAGMVGLENSVLTLDHVTLDHTPSSTTPS